MISLKEKIKLCIIIVAIVIFPLILMCVICLIEWKCPLDIDLNVDQWTSLFGGILSYIGTCLIGTVAYMQNVKMHVLNENIQKQNKELEAENKKYRNVSLVGYLSFLNILSISGGEASNQELSPDKSKVITIDFNNGSVEDRYYMSCEAQNESTYPITSIHIRITCISKSICKRIFHKEQSIYIGADKTEIIRIITPLNEIEKSDEDIQYKYELYITNALGFQTKGIITMQGLNKIKSKKYIIAQYSDINPLMEEGADDEIL